MAAMQANPLALKFLAFILGTFVLVQLAMLWNWKTSYETNDSIYRNIVFSVSSSPSHPHSDHSMTSSELFQDIIPSSHSSLSSTPPSLLRTPLDQTMVSMSSRNLPVMVQRSLNLVATDESHPYTNLTIALCHKSLFGDISIWMVLDWVAYHRLFGFDRIFLSYIPGIERIAGFQELLSLPYVTMFENTEGTVILANDVRPGYQRLGGSQPQMDLEARCLDHDAKDYDWVFLSDADEYLWFARNVSVKEFVYEYDQKGYDYLSFGKFMYTMKHRLAIHSSITRSTATTKSTTIPSTSPTNSEPSPRHGFFLELYPFTAGPFCTMPKQRGLICARKNGRAKVMVKPSVHKGTVNVHGTHIPSKRKGSMHLYGNVSHIKEWNAATVRSVLGNITTRSPQDFVVYTPDEIFIYGYKLYPKNPNGSLTMTYDPLLQSWFAYVASRGNIFLS